MRAGIFLAAVITLNAGFARATETGWPRIPPTKSAVQSPLSKPAPVEAAAPSAPDRIIFDDLGKHYCVGSALCVEHCAKPEKGCEVKVVYTHKLDQPVRISRIQLYAHDNMGPMRRTDLLRVKVDGMELGKFSVNRTGATISVPVNRTGQLITIEAMYNRNGALLGGEQVAIGEGALITDIYVFGRDTR